MDRVSPRPETRRRAEWRHDDSTRRTHRIPGGVVHMIQWPPNGDDGSDGAVTLAHYDSLATLPFDHGYVRRNDAAALLDELYFQRAVQTYLWALPALNMYAMKEGAERAFGDGYHLLPAFKRRITAKTRITTPNFDLIYAFGFLDLKRHGPLVIEVPAGLQGVLDDYWQRPIPSVGMIDGRRWSGDVGHAGPDRGKGGAYLLLPPDYSGRIPAGYYVYRSGTYGACVFRRAHCANPNDLSVPVRLIERTRIYPLGTRLDAMRMEFPNASDVPADMLYPQDVSAFALFARFLDREYVDPADREMRGMAAGVGIAKARPFAPDARAAALLDRAARTATRIGHVIAATPAELETAGGKYPSVFTDANGDFLSGDGQYRLRLPANIPAARLWSVTAYDALTGSGLDNGQP